MISVEDLTSRVSAISNTETEASVYLKHAVAIRDASAVIRDDLYSESALESLVSFLGDYTHVIRSLEGQSTERHVVSMAVLVTIMNAAVESWAHARFKELIEGGVKKPHRFMKDVVQPVSQGSPQITKHTLPLYINNVAKLIAVEKCAPEKMPCSIEVGRIPWFEDYIIPKFFEAPTEPLYEDLFGADGNKISELRLSDSTVNLTLLFKSGGTLFKKYHNIASNRAHMDAVQSSCPTALLRSENQLGSLWADPLIAVHAADWCVSVGSKALEGHNLKSLLTVATEESTPLCMPSQQSSKQVRIPENPLLLDTIVDPAGVVVTMRRSSDGRADAAMLFQYLGGRWAEYVRTESSRKFNETLSSKLGVSMNELFDVDTCERYSSTWAHVDILVHIVEMYQPSFVDYARERLYAPFPEDCEVISPIMDAHGDVLTCRRKSDGFVNLSAMTDASGDGNRLGLYLRTARAKALIAKVASETGSDAMYQLTGTYGGTWAHPRVATSFAVRCGLKFPSLASAASAIVSRDDTVVEEIVRDDSVASCSKRNTHFIEALHGDDGNLITQMRTSDGYVNATAMCNSAGKKWADFVRLESTKKFLEEYGTVTGVPVTEFIHSKQGGSDQGTWIHPDLAIELAAWCSVKLKAQVILLTKRFMRGEVTTEESKATAECIARAIQPVTCEDALVPFNRDSVMTSKDLKMPPQDDRYNVVPLVAHAPNAVYIICLGISLDGTHEVGMFGLTQDSRVRVGQQTLSFPHCKVTCIITCGRYNPKPIEDALKAFFTSRKVAVLNHKGVQSRECFGEFTKATDTLYDDAVDMVKLTMYEIVDSITLRSKTEYFNPSGGRPYVSEAIEVEKERTKQKQIDKEIARIDLEKSNEAGRIELEKTKEAGRIELEKARLEIRALELRLQLAQMGTKMA